MICIWYGIKKYSKYGFINYIAAMYLIESINISSCSNKGFNHQSMATFSSKM